MEAQARAGAFLMLPHFASPVLFLKFRVLIVFEFVILDLLLQKNLSGYMPELYLLEMVLCNFGSLRKMKMSWP